MKRSGWSTAVVGEHEAYLASGSERSTVPVSAGAINDARYTLDRAAGLFRGHGDGVLGLLGGRDLLRSWAGQVGALEDAGWRCTGVEPWTTWRRRDAPAVHAVILGAIDAEHTPPLFDPHEDPRSIAGALAWWDDVIGTPYLMTPGVSAHVAIKRHFEGRRGGQPYWGIKDPARGEDDHRDGCGDLQWKRAPLKTEFAMGYVHGFDLRAARLSALGVMEVAWGRLENTGQQAYAGQRAGYWLIPPPSQHKRHPPVIDPTRVHNRLIWVTAPIMRHLARHNIIPDVFDSWTAEAKRPFRTITAEWNTARLATIDRYPRAYAAVQALYREGAGLMAKAGGSIYRPDWYHTAMDEQRVTVLSHSDRIARTHEQRPLAIHTDCLWYASPEADPIKAAERLGIKLGTGLGMFDVKSTATAAEFYRVKAGAR